MRVRCYEEGCGDEREYDLPPYRAALEFSKSCDPSGSVNVVVEPVDDEARALSGWHADYAPQFKMFVADPVTQWSVNEVDTLNPYAARSTTED